jgi:hypothetical protein
MCFQSFSSQYKNALVNSSLRILIRSVRRGFFLHHPEGHLQSVLVFLWFVLMLTPSSSGILIFSWLAVKIGFFSSIFFMRSKVAADNLMEWPLPFFRRAIGSAGWPLQRPNPHKACLWHSQLFLDGPLRDLGPPDLEGSPLDPSLKVFVDCRHGDKVLAQMTKTTFFKYWFLTELKKSTENTDKKNSGGKIEPFVGNFLEVSVYTMLTVYIFFF